MSENAKRQGEAYGSVRGKLYQLLNCLRDCVTSVENAQNGAVWGPRTCPACVLKRHKQYSVVWGPRTCRSLVSSKSARMSALKRLRYQENLLSEALPACLPPRKCANGGGGGFVASSPKGVGPPGGLFHQIHFLSEAFRPSEESVRK